MTLAEINLISSKGQATPGKLYYDDNGKVYIGLKSGRIVRYIPTEQVTTNVVTDTATTTTTGVTSVDIKAGAGISVTGTSPITSAGSVTVINTAPDQTVVLTPGTGIGITGTYPNFTITNSSPSSGGTVTSLTAGTGLSGGTITTSGTVALANTTVVAGSYTNSSITVDAQGRITSASNGTAPVTTVSGTSPIVSSGGTTPAISISNAMANGTTKGAATFTASDFDDNGSGVISIDYTNGQSASSSNKGFLTSTDWNTFNDKPSTNITYSVIATF